MRYAVISDVHANLHALEAVMNFARRRGIDGWICAGDLVGYGVHPNECVDVLLSAEAQCVAGNHDLIATGALEGAVCTPVAAQTLEWTREHLMPDTRAALAALPLRLRVDDLLVAHGSLDDPQRYVRALPDAAAQLRRLRVVSPTARRLVLGHTHVPWAVAEGAGTMLHRSAGRRDTSRGRWLLNPGSVGQSRDVSAAARLVVLDVDSGTTEFHAVAYDVEACRRELAAVGFPNRTYHSPPTWRRRLRRRVTRPLGNVSW